MHLRFVLLKWNRGTQLFMNKLSLNYKVALIVVGVFVLSAILSIVIQRQVIMPSFLDLEESTATRNSERVVQAIDRELDAVSPSVSDWAYWTDTYEYAQGEYPEYIDDNFTDISVTLGGMDMNFFALYDVNGDALWVRGWDIENEEVIDLGELSGDRLDLSHPLFQLPELDSVVKGILPTSVAPLLVVSKSILTNDKKGPAVGTLVMGRFLDNAAFEKLSEQTRIDVTVKVPEGGDVEWGSIRGAGLLHSSMSTVKSETQWLMSTALGDLYGVPQLTIEVATPRDITARGASAVNLALLSLAATGLFTMVVMWFALQRVLLKPISKLTKYTVAVGEDENLVRRLHFDRQDEVGTLAHGLDEMVDKLQEARRAVIEQSYRSGISEMASGVLHNIGNAITPLNVRLVTVGQELRAAPSNDMQQASTELADPATSPERRADLQKFVELVGMDMANSMSKASEEIAKAVQQVNTVQEILVDQERASRAERVIESINIDELIRTSVSTLSEGMQSGLRLVVEPSVAEGGSVKGSQAALKQVVANVLVNAAESIETSGSDLGSLVITAALEEIEGQGMMHLRFVDTGTGIPRDSLNQLFIRGFSTKNREGSGHGLHWSANTLKSLGGWMSAESSGPGKGACFHIYLPAVDSVLVKATGTEG